MLICTLTQISTYVRTIKWQPAKYCVKLDGVPLYADLPLILIRYAACVSVIELNMQTKCLHFKESRKSRLRKLSRLFGD